MALAKQITSVAFASNSFVGGNDSSGSYVDPDGGNYATSEVYEIKIQNMEISHTPEFYNDTPYDVALNGKLRHNLRGYRVRVSLDFDQSLEANLVKNLINVFEDAFNTNNDESVSFFPDTSDKTNSFEVVIEDLEYLSSYTNTVGTLIPRISIISLGIPTLIPSYLVGP